jgi:hypothetical protein
VAKWQLKGLIPAKDHAQIRLIPTGLGILLIDEVPTREHAYALAPEEVVDELWMVLQQGAELSSMVPCTRASRWHQRSKFRGVTEPIRR